MSSFDDALGPLYEWLLGRAETERGVHAESLLVLIGALGGYAAQLAARETGGAGAAASWVQVRGADGRIYHYGDAINVFLLEDARSFCAIAREMAAPLSQAPLPAPEPIAAYVASTVGGPQFGRIRFPEGTSAASSPEDYVRAHWSGAEALLDGHGVPVQQRPTALGLAAALALQDVREIVPPATALHLLMESAIVAARIDFGRVAV